MLGKQVSEFCYENFERNLYYDFTNKMESFLDMIEDYTKNNKEVLNEYIESLKDQIQKQRQILKKNPEKIVKGQNFSFVVNIKKKQFI